VVTYNISTNQDQLLAALRSSDAEIRVITAIPARMNFYAFSDKGQSFRRRAKPAIKLYLDKLAPEEFGSPAIISFCFSNHSKIIMTERIGYIGSANFSEESSKNWECGILVRDPASLRRISAFVDEIEKDSVRYYGREMIERIFPLLNARQQLLELNGRLANDFASIEAQEIKHAIAHLRDAIAKTDGAFDEDNYEFGPIYSRIDDCELARIEEWYEESSAAWEFEEASQKLAEAEDGSIDAGELKTDNDGNIPNSEFESIVEDRRIKLEECIEQAQKESTNLQAKIAAVCSRIDEICREINSHIRQIDNT